MNFKDCKKLNVYDEYYTPEWVWKKIEHLIPKNKIIWEACMLNADKSKSMDIWRNLGYEVVGNTHWDILSCPVPKCDIIITNIPFETKIKQKVLQRLMDLDIPFIIIMSGLNIFSNYFQDIMKLEHIQIIYPKGKLYFCKDGEKEIRNCVFYSVFVAYKMNIENKYLWVN